jgi:hypothetical protein
MGSFMITWYFSSLWLHLQTTCTLRYWLPIREENFCNTPSYKEKLENMKLNKFYLFYHDNMHNVKDCYALKKEDRKIDCLGLSLTICQERNTTQIRRERG